MLPIAVVVGLLVGEQNRAINTTLKEQRGLEYLVLLRQLMQDIQLHRGRAATQLGGDPTARQPRLELAAKINRDFGALSELDQRYKAEFGVSGALSDLRLGWENLVQNLDQLSPQESTQRHDELINRGILGIMETVGNASGLAVDAEQASAYLSRLAIRDLPAAINATGLVRTLGITAASRGVNDEGQKAELRLRLALAEENLARVSRFIEFVTQASPKAASLLLPQSGRTSAAVDKMISAYKSRILEVSRATVSGPQFFQLAFDSFDQQYKLYDAVLAQLGIELKDRLLRLERTRFVTFLLIGVTLALTFLLVGVVSRSITRPVHSLYLAAQRLSEGDLEVRVPEHSSDELGTLARTFNETVVQLRAKAQADAEQLKQSALLQQNISEFLDVAMEIAQGDLTRRGRVTEDVLGSVVDAINLVLEEMGGLLKDVQKAADLVNQGAGELVRTSAVIVQGAQSQAQIAQQAQGQAVEVSGAIRQMAERAAQTTEAARRALQAAQAGQTAVQNTLVGMQGIRREVSNISKGIKGLSDRSLEISEIIETISGFAAQTNLLALNAAIEAAGAGEAGTRFAIVAEEVRRLAEDSAKAAQRVTTLIGGIQAEIQAVASSVEAGTKEVEEGYRIANQAGERLQEIAQLTTQSAQLVQAISQATQTQAQRVAQVGQAVQIIAGTASQTQEQSLKGRQAAEQLRQLAEQLSRNLARFRLPA
ncbi:methyl-accepting chemotaxis protein [Allomeiothermus silvanus]|uniref:methyl-accepting chemotaxis protein n=1 Tax=Allomeiothermus silvanus TaxID=52022 RepID=UPI0023F26924|nr:methyl-accepting chemotaxis protein [Allomeiothermus silvanus]